MPFMITVTSIMPVMSMSRKTYRTKNKNKTSNSQQLFHKKSHPIKYFYILILTFKCVKDMSIFFLYDKNKIVIFNNYFRI